MHSPDSPDSPSLPDLALRIRYTLWASVGVSSICVALSLSTLGKLYVHTTPYIFIISMIHNASLLIPPYLEQHNNIRATKSGVPGKLPVTSTKTALVCTWLVMQAWPVAIAPPLVMWMSGKAEPSPLGPSLNLTLLPIFEVVFVVLEIVVLFLVYIDCRRERELMPAHLKGQ